MNMQVMPGKREHYFSFVGGPNVSLEISNQIKKLVIKDIFKKFDKIN